MPFFRASVFFEDPTAVVGWTETWFLDAGDWPGAMTVMRAYVAVRIAIMMDWAFVRYLRVCNVDIPRDSLFVNVSASDGQGLINHGTSTNAGIEDALLYRRDTNISYNFFNHLFLHYVPATIFSGRAYLGAAAPAPWPANILAYQTFVLDPTNGFQVRKRTAVGPPPVYTYEELSIFDPKWRTAHKVGRPFGLLAGRRMIA